MSVFILSQSGCFQTGSIASDGKVWFKTLGKQLSKTQLLHFNLCLFAVMVTNTCATWHIVCILLHFFVSFM